MDTITAEIPFHKLIITMVEQLREWEREPKAELEAKEMTLCLNISATIPRANCGMGEVNTV